MSAKPPKSESKFNRPHIILPQEDTTWATEQKPCVLRFWHQCWRIDPYGSRWMKLATNLSDSAFRLARRILEAARLFIFRRVSHSSDGRTSYWEVRNLHGARVKDFWQGEKSQAVSASNKRDTTSIQVDTATEKRDTVIQTHTVQAFQEPSGTPQEHITNSFEEFVMCDSDTQSTNLGVDETAHAPPKGASPTQVESVSESEESPVVTDCTSLTLVDEQESQSAPPVTENSYCGVEPIIAHSGECSASPAQLDKWSDEARAARRELRPERENKLKLASCSGDNPGFEFLAECWDDVALWNKVKQLIAQYPEWGVGYAEGRLVGRDSS
ncbi:hypothetical protein [Nostoc sp.]|uniref:hypothetical protein n=1 Tax=Nostoc sp. TaxID=1180 RepID=UPI002FF5112F